MNQQPGYHHGDLRAALLKRAAEVIQEKGIEKLTLRGLARELHVSHGAPNRHFKSKADLLAALATEGYAGLTKATLDAAAQVSDDPWIRLNAMGQGFLRWSLDHPASFHTIMHPDLRFHETIEMRIALDEFRDTVRKAVEDAQADGRHPDIDIDILSLFTTAVPMGAAMILSSSIVGDDSYPANDEKFIRELIELVVPISNRIKG
jgi:AcrR family transcriptional regulator